MFSYKPGFARIGVVAVMIITSACAAPAPQVIEVTRVVLQTVVVTQIVERIVTATSEPLQPTVTLLPTQTESSILSLTPAITLTPWILPEGFAADVYPPPLPLSGQAAVTFTACPNPIGLEEFAGFPVETAIDLVNNLRSGDLQKMRRATDPALWFSLHPSKQETQEVTKAWFDGRVFPASGSAYAEMLSGQCGAEVVRLSWWAKVCPGPCQPGGSESLKDDYFFFWRNGVALIWLVL